MGGRLPLRHRTIRRRPLRIRRRELSNWGVWVPQTVPRQTWPPPAVREGLLTKLGANPASQAGATPARRRSLNTSSLTIKTVTQVPSPQAPDWRQEPGQAAVQRGRSNSGARRYKQVAVKMASEEASAGARSCTPEQSGPGPYRRVGRPPNQKTGHTLRVGMAQALRVTEQCSHQSGQRAPKDRTTRISATLDPRGLRSRRNQFEISNLRPRLIREGAAKLCPGR